MDRRQFLASLTTLALAGGCRSAFGDVAKARRQAVAEEMRRQIAAGYFSCACCANASGETWCEGNRRPGDGTDVPVRGDSLFEIASCSKTFTALVAALLWQEGKLDLDKPVYGDVTARDLASHRSGFTDAWMGRAGVYGKPWPFASDAVYEAAAKDLKPAYARGSKVVYACTNAVLLGFLIEQVAGMDLDAAARKYVWGPLGMKATTWRNCPDDSRTVRMYTHGPRPLGTKGDEIARGFTRPVGNAGVFTCIDDMRLYADDILNRRTFPKEVYELLYTPQIEKDGRRRSFGWDMSVGANPPEWGARTITHSGYTGQYVAIDPETKRFAVVLTNLCLDDAKGRSAAYGDRRRLAALVGG